MTSPALAFNNTGEIPTDLYQQLMGYAQPVASASPQLLGMGSGGVIGADAGAVPANPAATGGLGSIFDSFFQQKDASGATSGGWGSAALGLGQGLASAYMGMQQYGLAKDQLAFQKNAFNKNYAAQRQSTNTALEDRQRARVASNAGAYQSVGDYMKQNGVR